MIARKSSSSRLESLSHVIPCQWSCLPSRLTPLRIARANSRLLQAPTPTCGCEAMLRVHSVPKGFQLTGKPPLPSAPTDGTAYRIQIVATLHHVGAFGRHAAYVRGDVARV